MSMDTLIMTALSKDNHSYFGSDEAAEREDVTVEADRLSLERLVFTVRLFVPLSVNRPRH